MALDRQKILSELGSVVNQLQSANCGCLGSLFERSTPNTQCPSHGHSAPPCGGHHHSCTATPHSCTTTPHGCNHGRGPTRNSYSAPCPRQGNCMSDCDPQKLFATGQNFMNTNIVEPIVKEVYNELKSITPENTVANSPLAFQMGLPCSMPKDNQQGFGQNNLPKQSHPGKMPIIKNGMDTSGGMQIPEFVTNYMQNYVNEQGDRTQGVVSRNGIMSQSTNSPQMSSQASYGKHDQAMAKFKEMFPGIMGKGDLGFDPMNIAINMKSQSLQNAGMAKGNNNNQLKKAFTNSGQPMAPHTFNSSPDIAYANTTPKLEPNANLIPTDASRNPYNQASYTQNINNKSMYPNDQQIHYAVHGQPMIQKQVNDPSNCILSTISEMFNPNPIGQENEPVTQSNPETGNYNDLLNTQILPVDTYNGQSCIPPPYQYNTLGQPVELLPANVYHKPEPNLPQTLSPQPIMKPRFSNVKSTISKTSLTGNKAIGKTCTRNNLQRMYNEYKGSQSFIPQKLTPQGVTHSEGKLNHNDPNRNVNKCFESTGGDSVLNIVTANKPEIVRQNGDVPANNNSNNSTAEKLSPDSGRYRNGLQDITYTAYPMSTAWSFH